MAVTVDFGPCAECGEKNSTAATKCRACGATLPWVKPPKVKSAPQSLIPTQFALQQSTTKASFSFDWSPVIQIAGGLIFVLGAVLWCGNRFGFFPTFPLAGFITIIIGGVVWRAGSDFD